MKNTSIQGPMLSYLCSILLILMWVYAALSKLFIYEETRFDWLSHELIKNYVSTLAWLIPSLELAIVLLLTYPKTMNIGFYTSIMLLSGFTLYILYMFVYYPSTPCSCGGIINSFSWQQHVAFNLVFIALSCFGLICSRNSNQNANSTLPYS